MRANPGVAQQEPYRPSTDKADPLDLFPGVAPPLLATLSAPAVLRAGACCRRWRDVTRRVAGRRTAEGAGPASAVALLVRTEECEGRSEVACALAALRRGACGG